MKSKLIFILLLHLEFIHSQTISEFKINFDSTLFGINLLTKDTILSKRITYEYDLVDIFIDSAEEYLISKSEKNANKNWFVLNSIQLNTNKNKWTKVLDKLINNDKENKEYVHDPYQIYTNNKELIIEENNKLYKVNGEDFNKKWEIQNDFLAKFYDKNIGIIYNTNAFSIKTNSLKGIELSTGKVLWTKNNFRLGLDRNLKSILKDSVFIFVNSSLVGINVYTGKYWQIEGQFLSVEAKLNLLKPGYHDFYNVSGCSNFLTDSDNIYLVGTLHIFKFNIYGELLAQTYLEHSALNSYLMKVNNSIFVINKEFDIINYNAFIQKYNTDLVKLDEYIFKKEKGIAKFKIDTNSNILTTLHNRYVTKFDLNTFNIKEKIIFDRGAWQQIIKSKYYIRLNKFLFDTISPFDQNTCLLKTDNSISVFDDNFNFQKDINKEILHSVIYSDDQITVIKNLSSTECSILSKKDKTILNTEEINQVILSKSNYYFKMGKKVYCIDKLAFKTK